MKASVDELIKEYSKDPKFKKMYEEERAKLEIAMIIKELRLEMNLTRQEFAKIIGKSQTIVAKIERGNMNPSYRLLKEIADKLGKKMTLTFN